MDVIDISQIEWHSCESGCTGWRSDKTKWQDQKDDHCKKCGGKRFKTVVGRLVPVRVREQATGPFVASLLSLCLNIVHACEPAEPVDMGQPVCGSHLAPMARVRMLCWSLRVLVTQLAGTHTSTYLYARVLHSVLAEVLVCPA
jgi:hypothetical protein